MFYILVLFLLITASTIAEVEASQIPDETVNRYADVLLRANPAGLMVVVGANYQKIHEINPLYDVPSKAWKAGGSVGVNPAYSQFSLYGEWLPSIFANFRLQYDKYVFFGQYGGLLSFSSADQSYSDKVIRDREGDEERTTGDRLMVQPLLQAKIGRVFLRNKITLARYYFDGKGPYFLEWEHDILVKSGDTLYANDFSALLKLKFNNRSLEMFAGPYYEWVRADYSGLTRQRLGVNVFFSNRRSKLFLSQRIYARAGVNLKDRNREGGGFLIVGYGVDF